MSAQGEIFPSCGECETAIAKGQPQLVWCVRPAELDTPVSAMLRLKQENKPSFLLESVEKGETRGRYSIIGLMPDLFWRCNGTKAEIAYADSLQNAVFTPCEGESLEAFRALLAQTTFAIPEGLPPMAAGLVGYMTYDMVRLMERLPDNLPDHIGVPDACFMRPQIMVIFDAVADTMFIITTIWPDNANTDAKKAYASAVARIETVLARLKNPLPETLQVAPKAVRMEDFTSNTPKAHYNEMIDKAREHMNAGDIFQVVLSQRFSAPFTLPPLSLYRALRHLNPSPFLFYLDFCEFQIIGSSPEILVRLRDKKVTIRPIAGTRKRGKNKAEDATLAADLLSDPKELSEHLMLLDLGRNDVGRVAKVGTVNTTQHMHIENYSHVMHIVSNVEGEINPQFDALSALIAGFPAGTVSGAPKVRAMEIIDEMEVARRSFYAGCVGYFSASGDMDTCISLRTGLIKNNTLYVQSGGGIVADSNAQDEYAESLNKAKALMRAAEEAVKFV